MCVCVCVCVQYNLNGKDASKGRHMTGNFVKEVMHTVLSKLRVGLVALQDEAAWQKVTLRHVLAATDDELTW